MQIVLYFQINCLYSETQFYLVLIFSFRDCEVHATLFTPCTLYKSTCLYTVKTIYTTNN